MKRIIILLFTMLFGFAFAEGVSVDSDVIKDKGNPSYVEYNGIYDADQVATSSQIRDIGRRLGQTICSHVDDEIPFAEGYPAYKYSAGRVYGKDKSGADILYLGESVGVNTIKCLRMIVSGYVQEAFGYTQDESDLIAVAVCDWNANNYLNSDYFEKRYDLKIFSLFSDRCSDIGLSTDYHAWPNSRIVIPHQIADSDSVSSLSDVVSILNAEENNVLDSISECENSLSIYDFENDVSNTGANERKKWSWWWLLLLIVPIVIFLLIRFVNSADLGNVPSGKTLSYSNAGIFDAKSYDEKFSDAFCGRAVEKTACIVRQAVEKDAGKSKADEKHFYTTKEERMEHIPHEYKDGKLQGTWSEEPGNSMFIPADTPENQEIIKYLHEHGVEGIEYKDGVPDFSPVSEGTVEIPDMTEYRSSYFEPRPDGKPGNYEQAYQALADKWNKEKKDGRDNWTADEVRRWAKPRNVPKDYKLEVHENSDTKTCEFIRHDIHMFFKHSGGREECKIRDKENGRWNNNDNKGEFDE